MTTKDTLVKAREFLADEGNWTQGTLENLQGQRCAVGAILGAIDGSVYGRDNDGLITMEHPPESVRVFQDAQEQLKTVVPKGVIEHYNDNPSTTHACIVAAFDAAIERCGDDD